MNWMMLALLSTLAVGCGSNDDDDNNLPAEAQEDVTTLKAYKCYSGEINNLSLAYEVRNERVDTSTRTALYDCRGSQECAFTSELNQLTTGEGEGSRSCLNGTNGASLCVGSDLVYEQTPKGELLHVNTADGALIYCEKDLPVIR